MATDQEIQEVWNKIRKLDLATMRDGTYTLAVTSKSNHIKVPNVDRFISRRMSKEETFQHLRETYDKLRSCPTTGKQIVRGPLLGEVSGIKRLV